MNLGHMKNNSIQLSIYRVKCLTRVAVLEINVVLTVAFNLAARSIGMTV